MSARRTEKRCEKLDPPYFDRLCERQLSLSGGEGGQREVFRNPTASAGGLRSRMDDQEPPVTDGIIEHEGFSPLSTKEPLFG
jgi:hypothetical protein